MVWLKRIWWNVNGICWYCGAIKRNGRNVNILCINPAVSCVRKYKTFWISLLEHPQNRYPFIYRMIQPPMHTMPLSCTTPVYNQSGWRLATLQLLHSQSSYSWHKSQNNPVFHTDLRLGSDQLLLLEARWVLVRPKYIFLSSHIVLYVCITWIPEIKAIF